MPFHSSNNTYLFIFLFSFYILLIFLLHHQIKSKLDKNLTGFGFKPWQNWTKNWAFIYNSELLFFFGYILLIDRHITYIPTFDISNLLCKLLKKVIMHFLKVNMYYTNEEKLHIFYIIILLLYLTIIIYKNNISTYIWLYSILY